MEDSKLWITVFLTVVSIGAVAILLNLFIPDGAEFTTGFSFFLRDGYRLLSIFLGMLAGTSLGEIIKIRGHNKTGERLLADLIEELKVNIDLAGKGIPFRKGFWILGIRSGRAEYLRQEDRRELWEIYSRVTHYNDDLQHIHRAKLMDGYDVEESELRKELDIFCSEIKKRSQTFIQRVNNE